MLGASLSGGLDSSSIVGVVNKKFHEKIHTFSSIYEEKDCNEKEFIDCMNEYCDTIPHYIYPDESEELMQDMKDLIYYHDGPCHSASPYSGFCVYRGVKNHVKVLLDGQGADEVFGGYLFFFNAELKELLRQNTWISRVKAASMVFSVQKVWHKCIFNNEMVMRILGAKGYRKSMTGKKDVRNGISKGAGIKFHKKFDGIDLEVNLSENRSLVSELDKELNRQLLYMTMPRILHDVDRNSMARSLEVRLPFLDYRLVEFSYALPDGYKIHRNWTKYIVRKGCKKYLPKKIRFRRNKMGFPAPFDRWLRDERYRLAIKEYLDAFKGRNIVDGDALEDCYQEHMEGKKDWSVQLFRMMMLEMWFQMEMDMADNKWVM